MWPQAVLGGISIKVPEHRRLYTAAGAPDCGGGDGPRAFLHGGHGRAERHLHVVDAVPAHAQVRRHRTLDPRLENRLGGNRDAERVDDFWKREVDDRLIKTAEERAEHYGREYPPFETWVFIHIRKEIVYVGSVAIGMF